MALDLHYELAILSSVQVSWKSNALPVTIGHHGVSRHVVYRLEGIVLRAVTGPADLEHRFVKVRRRVSWVLIDASTYNSVD